MIDKKRVLDEFFTLFDIGGAIEVGRHESKIYS